MTAVGGEGVQVQQEVTHWCMERGHEGEGAHTRNQRQKHTHTHRQSNAHTCRNGHSPRRRHPTPYAQRQCLTAHSRKTQPPSNATTTHMITLQTKRMRARQHCDRRQRMGRGGGDSARVNPISHITMLSQRSCTGHPRKTSSPTERGGGYATEAGLDDPYPSYQHAASQS